MDRSKCKELLNSTAKLSELLQIDSRMSETVKTKWKHLFAEQFVVRTRSLDMPQDLFSMDKVCLIVFHSKTCKVVIIDYIVSMSSSET